MINIRLKDVNVVGGVSVLAFAAGAAVGYYIANKRVHAKYTEVIRQELEEAKAFYTKRNKTGEFATPQSAAEALNVYQGDEEAPIVEALNEAVEAIEENTEALEKVRVIFEGFDYEEEVKKRTDDEPYIITKEEFEQNEMEYEQVTLTYYSGDDVLADERDEPVQMINNTVGSASLGRFGHGSGDPNVVYTRHEGIALDCEIVLNKGEYRRIVHGFIEHAEKRKPKKFRGDDE
jgi:ABC-type multidrug transport system fused ATPase/permease subunit